MSNASPKIPSPDNDYKAPQGMLLGHAEWDATLGSIGARLRALEAKRTELQEVIDLLTSQALGVISESVSSEIEAQRARLAVFATQLEALKDAYDEYQAGGIFADGIAMRNPVEGIGGGTVQGVLAAIASRFAAQRQINVASLFFGAS